MIPMTIEQRIQDYRINVVSLPVTKENVLEAINEGLYSIAIVYPIIIICGWMVHWLGVV
jgi:hypothetical protein